MASPLSRELLQYLLALFKQWQGLVLGFVFSFALTILPSLLGKVVPAWLWGFAIGVVLLPASFLAWRGERRNLGEVLLSKPSARLRVERRSIVVHNSGAFGTFLAQIRIIEHSHYEKLDTADPQRIYVGFWEETHSGETEIANGHEDKLLLGILGASSYMDLNVLVFYHWQRLDRRHFDLAQAYPPDTPDKPSLTLQVTLSANPELREGAVVRKYAFTTEGLFEVD
jgi:hypothetical protein